MKRYEYVSVHIGRFVGAKSKEHRQIIDDYAKRDIVMLAIYQRLYPTMERLKIWI